ncbi:pappalysin-2-like, partial [Saccoglossus kowalevskii]|uniref:Pappalysin-2-like n=1 Tax=Saccoglossus kowalevskii TaxID=10224 RepID=A0ABM0M4H4_SACKO
ANIITCTRDGTWDSTFKACKLMHGECGQPASSKYVEFKCKGHSISDTCSVTCKDHDVDSVIQTAGTISRHSSIMCTGLKKWIPDPTSFSCVQKCIEKFIEDEMCDPQNNRAYCDWDGGDCCASTLGKEVDKSLCMEECPCLDPDAEENIKESRQNTKKLIRNMNG